MGPKIQNGLFFAASMVGIHLLFFMIKPELNANAGIGMLVSFVVPIFFVRRSMIQQREINEGSITFGEAFVAGGATYFIGIVLGIIAIAVFVNMMPEYRQLLLDVTQEASEKMNESIMGAMGASEQDIAEANDRAKEMDINPYNAMWSGIGILGSLFFPGAPIVLLTAAFIKKK